MRLLMHLLCLTVWILPGTFAVYADDAYTVDYHHELLGLPKSHTTFFHRPRTEDKATLLYTLSDLGVLGAVNPGSGEVVWRQLLANQNGSIDNFLRPVERESTVVSAVGERIDAWDALNGKQLWGNTFNGKIKDLEVVETVPGGTETRDVLALFEVDGKGVLRRLKGTTGDLAWEFKDGSEDMPLQISTNVKDVFVVSLHGSWGGYNLKVTILDPVTGKKISEYTLASKAEIHSPEDVLLVGANSASPIIAWTDRPMKNLKISILGKSGIVQSLPLKESDGEIIKVALHAPHLIQSLPHFLVHSFSAVSNRADVYHINLANGSITKGYELPKLPGSGTVSTSSQDANVFFTRITEDEVIIVSSASHAVLGRWPVTVEKDHGDFVHGVSEVVQKAGNTYASRSAVLTSDEDWVLVRNGIEAWSRVEGLSGAVSAAWAEIPESKALAESLEVEADSNPISAYIHRVSRHASDLQYLPAYLQDLSTRILGGGERLPQGSNLVARDNFGFSKIAVIATQRGRIYGLSSGSEGAVIWSSNLYEVPQNSKWDVKGIWVNSTEGIATIKDSSGHQFRVDTTTGKLLEKTGGTTLVDSAVAIDSSGGRWILTFDSIGNPGKVEGQLAPNTVLIINGSNNEVRGLRIEAVGSSQTHSVVWTFQPPPGQHIAGITSKPMHDPVASIGRVLGDRNVLYKYLNPNVVLVTALSDIESTASFYLLDSVSGAILYSTNHNGVDTKQPITSALTENWFAYSLWGDVLSSTSTLPGSKGYQIVVSELFESDLPNSRGPLGSVDNSSSLEPSDVPNADPAIPHVIAQSFIIPQPISHMAVTQTRQGITTRQLLCTVASQNSIIGIPRTILDPRRPVGRDPTAPENEEGLFRYAPVIEFDPKLVLTHKREVVGVKDVIATPALLESTSLVLAYGVDIFGTRVAPSAAFDILGKGFNKLSLVATVLGLGVGVSVLGPMVRRKQINGRWVT